MAKGKSFGGNMKLTVVMLLGKPGDVKLDAIRCLDEAGDARGFILAPGCDLPYDTPVANLEAVAPMLDVYQREIARTTAKGSVARGARASTSASSSSPRPMNVGRSGIRAASSRDALRSRGASARDTHDRGRRHPGRRRAR